MHAVAEADDTGGRIQNVNKTIGCGVPERVSIGEPVPSSAADRYGGTQNRALL